MNAEDIAVLRNLWLSRKVFAGPSEHFDAAEDFDRWVAPPNRSIEGCSYTFAHTREWCGNLECRRG